MKKITFILSVAALSIVTGGATAYVVSRSFTDNGPVREVFTQENGAEPEAGNHFTAYQAENYPDLTYAAENAVKAVVNIEKIEEVGSRYSNRSRGYDPFFEFFGIPQDSYPGNGMPRELRSGGSGVIISPDGYIVTNNHVIENASKLKITLYDGTTYTAKTIGSDPTTDVALLKIEAKDLPTIPFGDSDNLRLGEWVLAIGSPYDLRSTVTAGIVSAKARNLSVIPGNFGIESFIQTDAAVNPGNSGGALVNVRGQLVGINTVIKSPTGSYAGYSFAIPVSIVGKVVVDLKEYGVVQRAMLGVMFNEINSDFIEQQGEKLGITRQGGVYVAEVDPEGAANAAGVKVGDVITEIDGVKIDHSATLLETITKHRPGDKVKITLRRGGDVKQLEVTLRNKAGKTELLKRDYTDASDALGGTFVEVSDKEKKELKIDGGIKVAGINEKGILAQARIRRGYIITHINDRAIRSVNDLAKITQKITTIDGVYPDGRATSYSLVR